MLKELILRYWIIRKTKSMLDQVAMSLLKIIGLLHSSAMVLLIYKLISMIMFLIPLFAVSIAKRRCKFIIIVWDSDYLIFVYLVGNYVWI